MGQGIQEWIKYNFLKAVFHIFYLVHPWISWPIIFARKWSENYEEITNFWVMYTGFIVERTKFFVNKNYMIQVHKFRSFWKITNRALLLNKKYDLHGIYPSIFIATLLKCLATTEIFQVAVNLYSFSIWKIFCF